MMDFFRSVGAANSAIAQKLPKEWTTRDFETAVVLILSLEEGQEYQMDESSSTFQDAGEVLERMKASGSLDKIPVNKVILI